MTTRMPVRMNFVLGPRQQFFLVVVVGMVASVVMFSLVPVCFQVLAPAHVAILLMVSRLKPQAQTLEPETLNAKP